MGMKIADLECFKQSCRQNEVEYKTNEDSNFKVNGSKVVASLTDISKNAGGYAKTAYLIEEGGAIKLQWDNDQNYSTISKRLGKNGGKLTRDYTQSMIVTGVKRAGGIVTNTTEQPDGSLILKVSAM